MACGTAQGPDSTHRSDEAPAREAYLNALEPLPGDPGRARLQLSAYVRKYPGSTYAPNAALKLAELAMLQGDSEDAERWLNWLVKEHSLLLRLHQRRRRICLCVRSWAAE